MLRIGKYNLALEQYGQAIQVYERAGLRRELIEALNDLGSVQVLLGDAASAEKDFRRAAALARELGHSRGVTFNLISLGNLEWRRKRFEEAAALYSEALVRAREADDRTHMTASLTQLALADLELNRSAAALQAGQEALQLARAEGMRLAEAEALHALGEVERRRGQLDAAIARYASGEEANKGAGDPELGWRLAYGRGQALEKAERWEDAVAAYHRAIGVIESVRSQLLEERYRAGYIEDKYQVYVALVRLLLKLDRPREAFLFSEKLRARSYLDLLNRALPPISDPDQRQAESELRERIRKLQQAIEVEAAKTPASQQRSQALDLFSSELAAAERTYQNLLDDLRRSQPRYAAARALDVPPVEAVQGSLPPGTALIEYVIGAESLVLTCFSSRRYFLGLSSLFSTDI